MHDVSCISLGLGLSATGYRRVISWNWLHHNIQMACVPNKQVHECTPEDVVESFKVTSTCSALTGQAGLNVPGLNEACYPARHIEVSLIKGLWHLRGVWGRT